MAEVKKGFLILQKMNRKWVYSSYNKIYKTRKEAEKRVKLYKENYPDIKGYKVSRVTYTEKIRKVV